MIGSLRAGLLASLCAVAALAAIAASHGALAQTGQPAQTKGAAASAGVASGQTQAAPHASRRKATSGVAGPAATIAAPLTAQECTDLGGVVISTTSNFCASRKNCVTTSRTGAVKTECLEKEKPAK